jgi:AraC family transcriptional regulator
MAPRLEAGRFYGRTLQQRSVGDLVLADILYPAAGRLPRHTHERAYFCLIRLGSYTEEFLRRRRECGPSMLVFHPPGEPHSQSFGSRAVASFNVELGPHWLDRMRQWGVPLDQPREFAGGPLVELGYSLFHEFARRSSDDAISIESLTAEILAAVADTRPVGLCTYSWLRDARDLLEAHFDQPLSLSSVAREAGVHPVYFASVFRRSHGCSVGEYIRRLRVDFCRRRLAQKDAPPLTDIALAAGFADHSHFTRTFKRFTGMTPSEYRTFLGFKTN